METENRITRLLLLSVVTDSNGNKTFSEARLRLAYEFNSQRPKPINRESAAPSILSFRSVSSS